MSNDINRQNLNEFLACATPMNHFIISGIAVDYVGPLKIPFDIEIYVLLSTIKNPPKRPGIER